MDTSYVLVAIAGGIMLMVVAMLLAIWVSDDPKFGPIRPQHFPEPQLGNHPVRLPPPPVAPTPEQKAQTRAWLDKRETRLKALIRDTQSKA